MQSAVQTPYVNAQERTMDITGAGSPAISRKKQPSTPSLLFDPTITSPLHEKFKVASSSSLSLPKAGNPVIVVGGVPSSSSVKSGFNSSAASQWQKWKRRIPALKKVQELSLRVPRRVRMFLIFIWFCWKIVLILAFLVVLIQRQIRPEEEALVALMNSTKLYSSDDANATRVLYIVTSLAEFNNGQRKTKRGQDRFLDQLLPVMIENVETMVYGPEINLRVDLYLVSAYSLSPERETMIRKRLPDGVGFQFWDDALPLGYENRNSTGDIRPIKRALARNHRYVIRDKFEHYDLFVAFEDDMRVTGQHVKHYLELSTDIERLRVMAPTGGEAESDNVNDYRHTKFFGSMTRGQLERVVPGFLRVEVLVNEIRRGAQQSILPIPIDHDFGEAMGGHRKLDPSICCHVHSEARRDRVPERPGVDDVIVWETNIMAFSLRQMPPGSLLLDWVVLMMGPGRLMLAPEKIGGFWSGRNGAFKDERKPSGGEPKLLAQQGGWMATKEQITRMNNKLCLGSFLPPFDNVGIGNDGLDPHNVEFWSGSYQFFTGGHDHCNMQRIISMHPDHFSKHLLYHTSNNKQKQKPRERMVRANNLLGQLNSVMKMAQAAKNDILRAKK